MVDKRHKINRRPTRQPVKKNQERIDAILKDIAEGSTRFHASEANGIAYTTFFYWIKQGQFDLEHAKEDTIEAKLVKALRIIEQNEIKRCRNNIVDRTKGHSGAQWTLERVYWRQFGPNVEARELAEEIALLKDKDVE